MNNILQQVEESINVKLANVVRQIEANGGTIVKMQTGDPDFDTPQAICLAASNAMLKGATHYCASNGLAKLKQAIIQKLQHQNKIDIKEPQLLITHGAVYGVYLALQVLLNKGDEVIIIAPYWMPYHSNIILAGGKPVIINTVFSHNFQPSLSAIAEKITDKTKAIIINSPNNPTGAIYSKECLQNIAQLCQQHNVYLIADEVYEDISYQNTHYSVQALEPHNDKIITLFSFSKSYAMTGWRVGYMVANNEIISLANKLSQYITTSLSPFVQEGAYCAITDESVNKAQLAMLNSYQQRREFISDFIANTWLEKQVFMPQGAFYLWINITQFKQDSVAFVDKLLKEHQVCFTPGIAFGKESDNYIRMTFAVNKQAIITALTVLKELI